ncbi:hypothetical protein [Pseudomonas paraveronii]|uniref:hypothetical protein n=1 Tax=Pseudomonas paraveronii TaxID=3040598 RepID=UPI002AAFF10D|nr:hypothetical protein [Pseudomonas sp. FLM 11]
MTPIKERPILFSAPMVRAILEGRKTVTRRAVKFPFIDRAVGCELSGNEIGLEEIRNNCPYGVPGQRLWVRETWARVGNDDPGYLTFGATYPSCLPPGLENIPPASQIRWKPSIHMFRRDSRILMEITDVRVERLQDITYEQAAAEGVHRGPLREWCASDEGGACHKYPVPAFRDLWQSVGGDWDANPWVWVVEFKRVMQ